MIFVGATTWGKWFWADWMSDPKLRFCSYAARGLWMDMLCIAAEASPVGHVALDGRPLSPAQIARATGGSLEEVETLLAELVENGVASRTRKGALYSRRIVRDAKKADVARKKRQASRQSKPLQRLGKVGVG